MGCDSRTAPDAVKLLGKVGTRFTMDAPAFTSREYIPYGLPVSSLLGKLDYDLGAAWATIRLGGFPRGVLAGLLKPLCIGLFGPRTGNVPAALICSLDEIHLGSL